MRIAYIGRLPRIALLLALLGLAFVGRPTTGQDAEDVTITASPLVGVAGETLSVGITVNGSFAPGTQVQATCSLQSQSPGWSITEIPTPNPVPNVWIVTVGTPQTVKLSLPTSGRGTLTVSLHWLNPSAPDKMQDFTIIALQSEGERVAGFTEIRDFAPPVGFPVIVPASGRVDLLTNLEPAPTAEPGELAGYFVLNLATSMEVAQVIIHSHGESGATFYRLAPGQLATFTIPAARLQKIEVGNLGIERVAVVFGRF